MTRSRVKPASTTSASLVKRDKKALPKITSTALMTAAMPKESPRQSR